MHLTQQVSADAIGFWIDRTGCALHIFIIIINNMFSMTIFQQMADKHLEEQAAFYNLHKGTI